MFVLPIVIDPASSSFSTAVAVYGGIKLESIFEEQVVLNPSVQNKSFCANGMPERVELVFSLRSIELAFLTLISSFIVTKQFNSLYFLASCNDSCINSDEEIDLSSSMARNSVIDLN